MSDISELERNIAADRNKLSHSLDNLSAALNPDNVKHHATALAETYGGDLGRQAWDAARQNPAAFALVGAGLGLLFTGTKAVVKQNDHPQPVVFVFIFEGHGHFKATVKSLFVRDKPLTIVAV